MKSDRIERRANRRFAGSSPAVVIALATVVFAAAGCESDADRAARATYNQGLSYYNDGEWDRASEEFLEARRNAGQDPELRYRAAINLGLTYARKADSLSAEKPQEAIGELRRSADWLRDAVSLRPDDEQARQNLETVLHRIQVLADQLNQGKNSLEARLDRVIEDQRGLRDGIRALMAQVTQSGSSSEPVGFQADFDALATRQRTLLADVGTISDLAGEELSLLTSKAQSAQSGQGDGPQMSQEEQVRMVQLQGLEHYLEQARGNLFDTRRLLRKLRGDKAHLRGDNGLRDLKRAREQLLDPVTVLKSVAQDQSLLIVHTGALYQLGKSTLELDGPAGAQNGDSATAADPGAKGPGQGAASHSAAPAWLTAEHLRQRQSGIEQRTDEVLSRFSAVADARQKEAEAGEQTDAPGAQPGDPKQERALDAAVEAIPHLQQAVSAMQAASSAIVSDQLETAVTRQNQALLALIAAIERFSGIRDLIELVYREHSETIALLTPPDQDKDGILAARPDLAELGGEERIKRINEALGKNLDRLGRLEGLFNDELAGLDAQAAQAAQAGQDPANAQPQPGAGQPDPEQLEAAKQQYQRALELRKQAADTLARLSGAMADPASGDALAVAGEAMTHIEELRRIFFSIIEHLKELLRNQTETHDSTGSASAGPEDQLPQALGPLVDAQKGHAAMGDSLATALAEQADAAAQSQEPQAAEAADRMGQAAEEVRAANGQMSGAAELLADNLEAAASMSPDFEPTLEAQKQAIAHLEEAIRLLQPPQDQNQDQNQDQKDQEQQEQQEQQEMSQQQAQRRMQEVRDREAERMQKNRKQPKQEPVEKDW